MHYDLAEKMDEQQKASGATNKESESERRPFRPPDCSAWPRWIDGWLRLDPRARLRRRHCDPHKQECLPRWHCRRRARGHRVDSPPLHGHALLSAAFQVIVGGVFEYFRMLAREKWKIEPKESNISRIRSTSPSEFRERASLLK
jgi:hypothetical protein